MIDAMLVLKYSDYESGNVASRQVFETLWPRGAKMSHLATLDDL